MEQHQKEIRRALLVCVPYLLIVFFLDDIDKFFYTIHSRLANPMLVLYMFIATVMILAFLMHVLVEIRESYRSIGIRALLPLGIYLFALTNSFWSPLRISGEIFKSQIIYKAFRNERYGHAQMRMRKDGRMDIRYPGPFGMSDWEYGHWSGRGDTFYLSYEPGMNTLVNKPDTLVRTDSGLLIPAGIPADTLAIYKDRFFKIPTLKAKQ